MLLSVAHGITSFLSLSALFSFVADMWYVNADGKEGWLPSNILRAMIEDDNTAVTSGESTPVKLSSTGASADASDMSDSDGKLPDSLG